jgi:sugar lactone lactonase YvrE
VVGVESELASYCRGLDVDTNGTVYVAAAGCRAVLKITRDGNVSTVLQASRPWSPTSVVLYGNDLFVLEYLHTAGDDRREWLPRVRKVSADGQVVMVATIDRR